MLYVLSTLSGYITHARVSSTAAPPHFYNAYLMSNVVAEVVRTTANPKSIKGLQINKPVF